MTAGNIADCVALITLFNQSREEENELGRADEHSHDLGLRVNEECPPMDVVTPAPDGPFLLTLRGPMPRPGPPHSTPMPIPHHRWFIQELRPPVCFFSHPRWT